DSALSLPATCLLTMINAPFAGGPAYMDPVEREPSASAQAALDQRIVANRQFLFAMDHKTKIVVFAGGPQLKGVAYELFAILAEQYRRNHDNGPSKDAYVFVRATDPRKILHVNEATLRKRVLAARTSLSRQFSEAIDYLIDEQDIIQSRRWSGYRLNPY